MQLEHVFVCGKRKRKRPIGVLFVLNTLSTHVGGGEGRWHLAMTSPAWLMGVQGGGRGTAAARDGPTVDAVRMRKGRWHLAMTPPAGLVWVQDHFAVHIVK